MSRKPYFPTRKFESKLENHFNDVEGSKEKILLISIDKIVERHNPYPMVNLKDLIDSIKQHGLEQNLVVKDLNNGTYELISGHRRLSAIRQIIEDDKEQQFDELEYVYCKVIDFNENDIITNLRKHTTNLESRNLSKLPIEDRKAIVNDYAFWIKKARQLKLKINGELVQGKTREIIAKQLGISPRSVQSILSNESLEQSSKKVKKFNLSNEVEKLKEYLIKLENLLLENGYDIDKITQLYSLVEEITNSKKENSN